MEVGDSPLAMSEHPMLLSSLYPPKVPPIFEVQFFTARTGPEKEKTRELYSSTTLETELVGPIDILWTQKTNFNWVKFLIIILAIDFSGTFSCYVSCFTQPLCLVLFAGIFERSGKLGMANAWSNPSSANVHAIANCSIIRILVTYYISDGSRPLLLVVSPECLSVLLSDQLIVSAPLTTGSTMGGCFPGFSFFFDSFQLEIFDT